MKQTFYWKIINSLASLDLRKPLLRHERKFILNAFNNADPYDSEDLSDKQKAWLLKLKEKYLK